MQRGIQRRSTDGPLRALARLRPFARGALTVVASKRARLRAGGPVRSAVGGRRCAPDSPALLGPAARGKTRCASCARSAQTIAASQFTKRAGARGRGPCAARRRPFAPGPARPQPCGQRQRVFERSRNTTGARARGQCPDGAHGRRRAAQCSEGKPGVPAGPARSREVGAASSGAHGGIAAALAQRAAQRTLAAGEGGDG